MRTLPVVLRPRKEISIHGRIKEVRRALIFLNWFFREDLVKVSEPAMSVVCYHSRKGGAGVGFPLFLSS